MSHGRVRVLLLLTILTGNLALTSQPDSTFTERPPLRLSTVALETGIGTIGGIAGFLGLYTAIYLSERDRGTPVDSLFMPDVGASSLWAAMFSAAIGIPVGSTVGVCIIGNRGTERGSVLATGIGSLLGLVLGGNLVFEREWPLILWPFFTAVGATWGFNMSRHYKCGATFQAMDAPAIYITTSGGRPILGLKFSLP